MNIEEIPYIDRYFDVILEDELIFNEIKKRYPEIEVDLLSSKENPNCQCKSRIINYLSVKINHFKEDEKFIKELIDSPRVSEIKKKIDQNWNFIINDQNDRKAQMSIDFSYADKIYKVEKNDEAWSDFVNKIRASLMFQSFSVVDKESHLEVYFI